MKTNINELAREISNLNSTEISQLSEALLNYNVNATIYNFGIVPTFEVVSDIETFKVYMASAGQKKIAVVKLIKEVFGLDLKDAKNMVDNTPCLLAENLSYDDVKKLKNDFEDIGATISIIEL